MCGIVGLFPRSGERFDAADAERSLAVMQRRGPDAEGVRVEDGCVLGHRRLAIQDLDARSNQPMDSAGGRYVISFNGEIYNVAALQ
jgi:asparagine synthase (glutamine-hydrolysing)